ncbi:MAG: DUF2304 family protein [Candidatus Woesearchaeota archaeon]
MVLAIQIIGIFFGLFMLYYTSLHYQRNEFSKQSYLLWQSVWVLFLLLAVFPFLLLPLQASLAFSRVMDMLVVLGLLFLLFVCFYNFLAIKKTEQRVERLVRSLAKTKVIDPSTAHPVDLKENSGKKTKLK